MKKLYALKLMAVISSTFSIAWANAAVGGDGSGGANVCRIRPDSAPVLLDLVPEYERREIQEEPGIKFEVTGFTGKAGADDEYKFEDPRLLAKFNSILDRHIKSSPIAVSVLKDTLGMPMYGTIYKPRRSFRPDYSESTLCSDNNTTAVVFNRGVLFFLIDTMNELSLLNQAATLIHEGFRFLQHINPSITDKEIQQYVRMLVFSEEPVKIDDVFIDTFERGMNIQQIGEIGLEESYKSYVYDCRNLRSNNGKLSRKSCYDFVTEVSKLTVENNRSAMSLFHIRTFSLLKVAYGIAYEPAAYDYLNPVYYHRRIKAGKEFKTLRTKLEALIVDGEGLENN